MIKKILYFTGHDISKPDGLGTNEFEFTVLLANQFGKNAWCVLPKLESSVPHLDKLNSSTFNITSLRTPLAHFKDSLRVARDIANLVQQHDIDIIVVRLTTFPLIPLLLQRRHGLPVALKTLGRIWLKEESADLMITAYHRLCHWLTTKVVQAATAIDTSLPKVLKAAQSIAPKHPHIMLIRNAANVDMFKPAPKAPLAWHKDQLDLSQHWPVLGFGGSLPSLRGARELIQSLPAIVAQYPDTVVLVAGWDDSMDEVLALARQLGMTDRCHFLGWVPYKHMPEVINLMDIGFSFFEASNLKKAGNASQKVRQYLACGKPVISIEDGHLFLEKEDLGSVVDHTDTQAVTNATLAWIQRLEHDSGPISKRLRKYSVEHLSTKKAFELRIQLWERALTARTGKGK